METINSAQNRTIKYLRGLQSKKGRAAAGVFVVEGAKNVAEIGSGWDVEMVAAAESFARMGGLTDIRCKKTYAVADHIFPTITDSVTPQGILAVVKQRKFTIKDMLQTPAPLLLLLEEMSDPGNLGTILRIAHALSADGVVLSANCAEVFSPKVVRASAGSIFHTPFVAADLPEAIATLKQHKVNIVATTIDADTNIYNVNLTTPTALLIGNEARGLSPAILRMADVFAKIPIAAESLNASVACGIMAYEAARQRADLPT